MCFVQIKNGDSWWKKEREENIANSPFSSTMVLIFLSELLVTSTSNNVFSMALISFSALRIFSSKSSPLSNKKNLVFTSWKIESKNHVQNSPLNLFQYCQWLEVFLFSQTIHETKLNTFSPVFSSFDHLYWKIWKKRHKVMLFTFLPFFFALLSCFIDMKIDCNFQICSHGAKDMNTFKKPLAFVLSKVVSMNSMVEEWESK